ncbi:MAG: PDGLE domain-containing protein [Candidatus Edwardsbacteria bacterium]|nr:PDGLE domain-containing protein [Candidatus Edwardsbacteria bacterium]
MNKRTATLISLLAGLAVALILSPFASPWPDGLEKVAENKGFLEKGEHSVLSSPIPDYAMPGVKHEGLATSLAGVLGVLLIFGTGWGLQALLARKN